MGESFTVNSEHTKQAYKAYVDRVYDESKYATFSPPRIGPDRSINQNSLFHVWLTEFAAHLAKCHKSEVTKGMLAGIKFTAKELYYRHSSYFWMIHTVSSPLTGRNKTDYTSSGSWHRGEMFDVLNWLQMFAAEQGCVLESRGEHAKLKREAK